MLSRFNFNHYILLSEKWLTKIALLWCAFSVLLGFVVQVEIALIIAAPLMTLCMFFAGMILSSSLIGFQKINPFAKSNPNFIKFAILFFWSFGIIAALYFLSSGIFQIDEKNSTRYFLVVAAVFPLGPTLGAAKEWNKD